MRRRRPVPNLRNLDAEAITAMLSRHHADVSVEHVQILERARCGDGIASTADRVALRLNYGPGDDAGLPSRMVLKTLLLHPVLRFGLPAILSLASASRIAEAIPGVGRGARSLLFVLVGLYQRFYPHAPDAMYLNEVRFYTDIRPELTIEAPRTFGGLFEESTRHFGILMEDLALRSARFPNATTEVSLDELSGLVATLAELHAHFWASPRLEGDLGWVPTRLFGGMFPVFDGIGRELIRYQVEHHAFKAALLRPLNRSVDQLWEDLWESQRILAAGPATLLHGDAHIANTYLLPDGSGGLLDWQLMARGNGANDLTYLLVTALAPEERRKHERELIAFYLDELRRHGVEGPPRPDEAWRRHRLAVIWGLVIGWLITPPVNYGTAITEANIARLVTAAEDLESFQALA
jgi:hypothetical protein